jgi:disulfide bond formation protein DsbB
MNDAKLATIGSYVGLAALVLILGALGFQYLDRLPPCEMCMWQRYPHIAAAVVGIGGFLLMRGKLVPASLSLVVAVLATSLVAISGAIGVYHAGVEWHWWAGPAACTGPAFRLSGGPLDLNAPVVMCDHAAWRLFGLSLAGYNAVFSFAIAAAGFWTIAKTLRTS